MQLISATECDKGTDMLRPCMGGTVADTRSPRTGMEQWSRGYQCWPGTLEEPLMGPARRSREATRT